MTVSGFGDSSYILRLFSSNSQSIPKLSPYSRLRGAPKRHRDVPAEDEGKYFAQLARKEIFRCHLCREHPRFADE